METFLPFTIAIQLTLLHQAVSCSENPVFVEKGQDVRLDVQGYMTVKENLKRLNSFKWTFNTDNVVTYVHEIETEVTPKYQGRAEFIEGNFSLLLKNLTEGDSGCYTAAVSADRNKDVAKYQISVQERVEPPVLTVNSVSLINGICNVTVTCRGQSTSVTSSCNSSTCSQVGGESRGAETSTVPLLSVYVAGGSIICNHSNQVSWANDTKKIKTICVSKSGPEWEDYSTVNVMTRVIIIIIISVGLGAAAVICWLK